MTRQLQFLNHWERESYQNRWTSSVLWDAAGFLRVHADRIEADRTAFLGVFTTNVQNYTVQTARDVFGAILAVSPLPRPPRDGRQIARKMRRAARRAEHLARYKAAEEVSDLRFLAKGHR